MQSINKIKEKIVKKSRLHWDEVLRILINEKVRYGAYALLKSHVYGVGLLKIAVDFISNSYKDDNDPGYHSMDRSSIQSNRCVVYWTNRVQDAVDLIIRQKGWEININKHYRVYYRSGYWLYLTNRVLRLYVDPGYYNPYHFMSIYSCHVKHYKANLIINKLQEALNDIDRIIEQGYIYGNGVDWFLFEVLEMLGGDYRNICGTDDIDSFIKENGNDISTYKAIRKAYYKKRDKSLRATVSLNKVKAST